MKSLVLLHAAEPRLAGSDPDGPGRAAQRIEAFGRLLAAAPREGAPVVVIAGRLLESGRLDPGALGAVAGALAVAAASGVTVITTIEAGEQAWLDLLPGGDRLVVLACPPAADAAPPRVEPLKGLRVIGLGRPGDRDEFRRRIERVPAAARGAETVIVLATTPDTRPGAEELEALAGRASWLALGGEPDAAPSGAQVVGPAADPGPLTRFDFEDGRADPGFLVVSLERRVATARRLPSGDPPLRALRIDVSRAASAHGVELALSEALATLPPGLPALLRVDLDGEPGFDPAGIDETRLISLAHESGTAVAVEIRSHLRLRTAQGLAFGAHTSRAELEAAALDRVLEGAADAERELADRVLARLSSGDEPGALAALTRYLEEAGDAIR